MQKRSLFRRAVSLLLGGVMTVSVAVVQPVGMAMTVYAEENTTDEVQTNGASTDAPDPEQLELAKKYARAALERQKQSSGTENEANEEDPFGDLLNIILTAKSVGTSVWGAWGNIESLMTFVGLRPAAPTEQTIYNQLGGITRQLNDISSQLNAISTKLDKLQSLVELEAFKNHYNDNENAWRTLYTDTGKFIQLENKITAQNNNQNTYMSDWLKDRKVNKETIGMYAVCNADDGKFNIAINDYSDIERLADLSKEGELTSVDGKALSRQSIVCLMLPSSYLVDVNWNSIDPNQNAANLKAAVKNAIKDYFTKEGQTYLIGDAFKEKYKNASDEEKDKLATDYADQMVQTLEFRAAEETLDANTGAIANDMFTTYTGIWNDVLVNKYFLKIAENIISTSTFQREARTQLREAADYIICYTARMAGYMVVAQSNSNTLRSSDANYNQIMNTFIDVVLDTEQNYAANVLGYTYGEDENFDNEAAYDNYCYRAQGYIQPVKRNVSWIAKAKFGEYWDKDPYNYDICWQKLYEAWNLCIFDTTYWSDDSGEVFTGDDKFYVTTNNMEWIVAFANMHKGENESVSHYLVGKDDSNYTVITSDPVATDYQVTQDYNYNYSAVDIIGQNQGAPDPSKTYSEGYLYDNFANNGTLSFTHKGTADLFSINNSTMPNSGAELGRTARYAEDYWLWNADREAFFCSDTPYRTWFKVVKKADLGQKDGRYPLYEDYCEALYTYDAIGVRLETTLGGKDRSRTLLLNYGNGNIQCTYTNYVPSDEPVTPDKPETTGSTSSSSSQTEYYSLTAVVHGNGTINNKGVFGVQEFSDMYYQITPNVGATIQRVLVDGVDVGAVSSYNFSHITANHTIEVFFSGSGSTTTGRTNPQTGIYS